MHSGRSDTRPSIEHTRHHGPTHLAHRQPHTAMSLRKWYQVTARRATWLLVGVALLTSVGDAEVHGIYDEVLDEG